MSGIPVSNTLLARHLREIADGLDGSEWPATSGREPGAGPASSWPDAASAATTLYLGRRQRSHFFDDMLFGEGAWDMLLTLFAAAAENRALSLAECCAGAHVPPATALRYVSVLEQCGKVRRTSDRRDALISLTEPGFAAMYAYLTAVSPGQR